MKIYVLTALEDDGFSFGDTYEYPIRAYYLKEEAEEALKYREILLVSRHNRASERCVEYELDKLDGTGYYRKDKWDSSGIYGYELNEIEVI